MTLRLATRRSPLALAQAQRVANCLLAWGEDTEIVGVDTRGDRDTTSDLTNLGGQGVFAVEVQRAVLDGRADVAVHSAKDLPAVTPEGLALSCVPERLDPADVMVGAKWESLGPGATVATGSPRRRALLLERRPDLNIVGLRGNMATRLGTLLTSDIDAIVAAAAALIRLEVQPDIIDRLDPTWFVPQVGQGAIALESRRDDVATQNMLARINDEGAQRGLEAERAFLRELGAGCSVPAGATSRVRGDEVTLSAVMVAMDGSTSVRGVASGVDVNELGTSLARELRDVRGGGRLWGTRN